MNRNLSSKVGSVFIATLLFWFIGTSIHAQVKSNEIREDFLYLENDSNFYVQKVISKSEQFLNTGDIEKAKQLLHLSIKSLNSLNAFLLKAELLYNLGKIHETTAEYKDALICYEEALTKLDSVENIKLRGLINMGLANIWWRTGNNHLALDFSLKSGKLFESISDTSNLIMSKNILAGIYIDMGNIDNAERIYDNMLELAISMNDSVLIAQNYEYKGVVFFFKGKYVKAIENYSESLSINLKLNNLQAISVNYGNIAEAYERSGILNLSLTYFLNAIKIQEELKFNSGLIFLYYGIGKTYSKMKKWAMAEDYFDKSHKLIQLSREYRENPTIYEIISSHYIRKNDFKNAYLYYVKYSMAKDSLFSIEKNEQIEKIKIKNEIERREQEKIALLNEKSANEKQLMANKVIIRLQYLFGSFIFVGLIASIIFTFIFFRGRQKLKTANTTKDKLFSLIGHDLRGPIGTNRDMLGLLIENESQYDSTQINSFLINIQKSLDSTYNLLDEILIWSKADQGIINYNPRNINLYEIISDVIDFLEHFADSKSIMLNNEVEKNNEVYADSNLLSTILRNLISNSIKFTKQGGSIKIKSYNTGINQSSESSKMITVSVEDNGIGIKNENLSKLFDKKFFFTTFGTNSEKGTGLGLNLCKQFIETNGGRIWVESQFNKGSKFFFTIPLTNQT